MISRKRILIVTLCVLFFSCKKDKNIDSPTVQISAPAGLQTFNVFDTITVKGHVSDPQGLQSVSIYLATDQSVEVLPASAITITSNDMGFSWSYVLSDVHLASGQYYLTVSASNGTNTTHAYQKIYVNAYPTYRRCIYAITRSSSNVKAWKIDSVLHVSPDITVTGNYSSSDICSYYQQLFIAAYDSGNVNGINEPAASPAWNVPGNSSPMPFFTNIYSYGDAAYVSFYGIAGNGYVKYFDHKGVMQTQAVMPLSYYPIKTYVWEKYLFVEQKNMSSSTEYLALYYAQSGTGYQQIALPGPVIAMYGADNDHVMIFGNQTSGSPYMMQYSISGNIFFSPVTLPAAKILSATEIDPSTFLIGFSNGSIYRYTYNTTNFLSYITGVNASHMRYDAINNQLVVASNKVVQEYNCSTFSGTLAYTTTTFADSVLDVQILFNK